MKRRRHAANGPRADASPPRYRLRLFVAGDEPNSARARNILTRVCEGRLSGRWELEVVDVFTDYQAAIEARVLMVPTLVVEAPPATRIIVGSFRDEEALLDTLALPADEKRS